MESWGWRLPFLVAAPLGLIGMYLRSRMEDTPVFRELDEKGEREPEAKTAFKDLLTEFWKPLLLLGGLVVALNVVNYTLLSYMPTYLQAEIGLSSDGALDGPAHRHALHDAVPAVRRRALGPGRPQARCGGSR